MSVYREPFSQLNRQEFESLIKNTTLYAVRKLGNRQGRSPELDAEDLMMRSLEDTMIGADRTGNGAEAKGRRWDPAGRWTLRVHLQGCIRSYISHYFESSEGTRRVDLKSQRRIFYSEEEFDVEEAEPSDLLIDEITPEDELEADELNQAIDRRVQQEGEPVIIQMWEYVWRERLDLKHDRIALCERLEMDPTPGCSDYQRFNRYRKRLKQLVELAWQDCQVAA